jgi:hypothetical protein
MTEQFLTINAASDLIEQDRRKLTRILRHTPPDNKAGGKSRWRLPTIVAALEAAAEGRSGGLDLTDERATYTREIAARERRKNAEAEGRLVDVDDMVRLQSIDNSVVRERLLSLPGALQGELGVEGANAVDGKVREILLELSDPNSYARRLAYEKAGLGELHTEAIAAAKEE